MLVSVGQNVRKGPFAFMKFIFCVYFLEIQKWLIWVQHLWFSLSLPKCLRAFRLCRRKPLYLTKILLFNIKLWGEKNSCVSLNSFFFQRVSLRHYFLFIFFCKYVRLVQIHLRSASLFHFFICFLPLPYSFNTHTHLFVNLKSFKYYLFKSSVCVFISAALLPWLEMRQRQRQEAETAKEELFDTEREYLLAFLLNWVQVYSENSSKCLPCWAFVTEINMFVLTDWKSCSSLRIKWWEVI